ncbi:TetR/AcrR family transcriptional regulator [Cytobacillus firmus]|uniref:TetR/AcrR family transcriptional regulator n=1 Tax=Cytobacillus firmus TaxID=1399 RepID=UPI0018CCF6F8|nr:TetR/AcrR family transcriptional regulator [Cytobacillus firmus]MBG9547113.1 TetR family transcriptional regulator [Cytobacillus firmus]MBG9604426.1 TetR family transcriptional regulator [Cytobacillus firmus]MBG9655918.1 TetR family transcriptional regulator [Cytobacillus firmus]MED1905297.1 TetR/AcrR family transcriptional regulator [Cytobacillus firmus]MED1939563.1 TetR/AcrR family transcriptional regulator [Cytobacillus firmus]
MNNRKMHVIKKAHQLFLEKGFQATSIQDILDYSGISKGTFYNYFSSKNELLISIFKTLHEKMESERDKLLIGQDPSSIEVFTQQIELQMNMNRTNKLVALFEEVLVSNDPELKQFIKEGQLRMVNWIFTRFIEIFGEDKKPYLLDCAIMFLGILHHNVKYYTKFFEFSSSINPVVRYSVERIRKVVEEVSSAGDYLLKPELIENRFRQTDHRNLHILCKSILTLKKSIKQENQNDCMDLLDFIQEEMIHSKKPRKFLIESALQSLSRCIAFMDAKEFENLEKLVLSCFKSPEEESV